MSPPLPNPKIQHPALFFPMQQPMADLFDEHAKIEHGGGVGRQHPHHFAILQALQGFL
jgi:hypothetical protein